MTVTIEVDELRVRYGKVTALDGVTCTLTGDKIYGLLGRNGAGKTTLLSALAAFRPASGGAVRADGAPVFENPAITRQLCLIRTTLDTLARTTGFPPCWGSPRGCGPTGTPTTRPSYWTCSNCCQARESERCPRANAPPSG